jgi:regulator of nucleoside diphosphate kinase
MTMLEEVTLSPDIVLSKEDHRQLTELALAGLDVASNVADDLLYELDRASVLPAAQVSDQVVRLGSTVRYRTGDGEEHEFTLVLPAAADIARGRVSVMTPVGAALIGLSTGQSITWLTRDRRRQVLTVLRVAPPDGSFDAGSFERDA